MKFITIGDKDGNMHIYNTEHIIKIKQTDGNAIVVYTTPDGMDHDVIDIGTQNDATDCLLQAWQQMGVSQ